MTPELREKISRARSSLSANPMGFVIGEVRNGVEASSRKARSLTAFDEFLLEADGGRFGAIDIWSSAELVSKQYVADDLPGPPKRWLVIGQILYDPLAMDLETNELWLFRQDIDPEGERLGDFDDFFSDVIFGEGYARVIPDGDQDEWYLIIRDS